MDIRAYNREAWDREVEDGNLWTIPVTSEEVTAARQGTWQVFLTATRPVPRDWFPELQGKDVLCLASGGGQQGPILAAAGSRVTVYDNSPKQLAQDRLVADREGLELMTIEGDMADLSVFPNETFDLIFHPVSNLFVPDIHPVWAEAHRVIRPGGILLAGFLNPLQYIFDLDKMDEENILEVKYTIPFSDLSSLSHEKRESLLKRGWPVEFSHTLEDQIGGQLNAGFVIIGFYEDVEPTSFLSKFIPTYIATRAIRS
jgi:SAM-dependent methyltransferase